MKKYLILNLVSHDKEISTLLFRLPKKFIMYTTGLAPYPTFSEIDSKLKRKLKLIISTNNEKKKYFIKKYNYNWFFVESYGDKIVEFENDKIAKLYFKINYWGKTMDNTDKLPESKLYYFDSGYIFFKNIQGDSASFESIISHLTEDELLIELKNFVNAGGKLILGYYVFKNTIYLDMVWNKHVLKINNPTISFYNRATEILPVVNKNVYRHINQIINLYNQLSESEKLKIELEET